MPARTPRVPKYRHYRPKDLAVVRIDGRDHYLGRYNSPESREKYHRLVSEWLARGVAAPAAPAPAGAQVADLTINELLVAFWTRFAESHYRLADGSPSGELSNYRDSLRTLRQLYGSTPAVHFGPLALKAVRQSMIEAGLARTTINQRIGRVVRVFKWAVENELVPPATYQALAAVRGLQRGRSNARETDPVRPVDDARVDAIRPHVAPQVWAMVELQRLTGMRPGEVCGLRGQELCCEGAVWTYTPTAHKTAHRGKARAIFLGPRAQEVLRPWLREDLASYLFSPRDAVAERQQTARVARPGKKQSPGKACHRKPGRAPGAVYTTKTYYHAIQYGCRRAGVEGWHPNQLRHLAATRLRSAFGLDVTRAILGHSTPVVTEIYAEMDQAKAASAIERYG